VGVRDLPNRRTAGLLKTCALAVVFCIGSAAALRAQPGAAPAVPAAQSTASDSDVPTAPVRIDGATLFWVRGTSSYPADARARAIRDRIITAAADSGLNPDAIHVQEAGSTSRVVAGNATLQIVADADADVESLARAELAAVHAARIREAVLAYRADRSTRALTGAAWRTAAATLALVVAIALLLTFWKRLDRLLDRKLQARVHTIGIQSFDVVRAEQIHSALSSGFFILRVVIALTGLLVYAGFVLRQWPATREFAQSTRAFALSPLRVIGDGIVANIPSIVFLFVLFLLVRVVLRLVRLFFQAVEKGSVVFAGFDAEWAQPTYKLVRIAVVAFGLIVAYPYIPGSNSEAFKGVSLFIGIVFSLGSSSAIANIIAGYTMTYRRAFKLGDRVKIGDAVGEVIGIRLQVTHLRTMKNEEVVIPNSEILSGEVVNYTSLSRDRGLVLHTEVGIGYETPWRQVEAMLLAAAARTPGLGPKPEPYVNLKKLGDFAVVYELNAPCGDVLGMARQYTALHQNVLDVFNEHGVQIMTPAYEGDPPEPKIVRPENWHVAPATQVNP
jgi:small-conductance mechanosensitive channel